MLFVFLFLTALYESWSVPFAVLLAVPIGAFGAILTLVLIPRLSDNVYAQIGLITLIGLAAKNAILIVEFAKERVDRGMPMIEATLEAVKLRLRPILMTSMAFIFGVSPLAFAEGAGAQARQRSAGQFSEGCSLQRRWRSSSFRCCSLLLRESLTARKSWKSSVEGIGSRRKNIWRRSIISWSTAHEVMPSCTRRRERHVLLSEILASLAPWRYKNAR